MGRGQVEDSGRAGEIWLMFSFQLQNWLTEEYFPYDESVNGPWGLLSDVEGRFSMVKIANNMHELDPGKSSTPILSQRSRRLSRSFKRSGWVRVKTWYENISHDLETTCFDASPRRESVSFESSMECPLAHTLFLLRTTPRNCPTRLHILDALHRLRLSGRIHLSLQRDPFDPESHQQP